MKTQQQEPKQELKQELKQGQKEEPKYYDYLDLFISDQSILQRLRG
jgi:hypothetical protein